jgi:hypothetical protein
MAKLILEIEEDYAFQVFGIVSTSRGHKLGWDINKSLGLDLRRDDDIEVIAKNKTSRHHAYFSCFDEQLHVKYRLIENKKGVSLFLPEVKNADYLLIVDVSEELSYYDIKKSLKNIQAVLLVFEIDLEALSAKQNLLLAA